MPGKRVQRTIQVPEDLDIELKKLAADLRTDKSDLYEAGARILKTILEAGRVPDDLGYILAQHDPDLVKQLREYIEALRHRKLVNPVAG